MYESIDLHLLTMIQNTDTSNYGIWLNIMECKNQEAVNGTRSSISQTLVKTDNYVRQV